MARSKRSTRTAGSSAEPSARVTSNANNSNAAAVGRKKKKQQTLQDWTGGPTKSKSAEGGQKRWHNSNGEYEACVFQSDNYKLHCGIHVLSQELHGVRYQMAKCKGMNERLGKKNEERKKKDKQHEAHEQGLSVPQKLLDFEAGMKQCKEQSILDKLSRAG